MLNKLNENSIYQGDSLELLKKVPDNSVDLIFADPPYNLQLNQELYRPNNTKVDAVNDNWDKFNSFKDYDDFCEGWLKECKRILKPTGSIWVIGSYHNIFRLGKIIQDIGLWVLNDIVWVKTNPMPNFKGTRFNNAHETLIWASKSKDSRYKFNYHSMKCMNDDLQMRSDWLIPICQGDERIKINGVKAHSTQKPAELLYRVILSSSNYGDLVLDPFFGSGTTGAVAKRLGRKFIGFEKEENYVKIAKERIDKIIALPSELLEHKIEKKKPKVTFGNLIEKGYIKIGETLFSKDKKGSALVNADASVSFNGETGSIHKISANFLKKTNHNGWDYWYVIRQDKLFPIDKFRYEYEEKYLLKKDKALDFKDNFGYSFRENDSTFIKYQN
jgi:DNA modification methylase